ncbi:C13 family peptidase [Candidatus Venteria ishoeyi]|uniref:non-specific serine/threonine protein kinase n=1 Tax=Candidatus Venteria ishoeyi TaxID=1899563 RepID=A0A1H6F5L3_9GAMM|nr:C13 family peptidase [Candidatus Venteria ishoeyi]SEH04264.1 Peptidase C13 family protein [Candidatus Venteria ishoeyi]
MKQKIFVGLIMLSLLTIVQQVFATYEQISMGMYHSCALKSNGSIACWGYNSDGRSTPPDGVFSQVSAGGTHSCALKNNGEALCWGWNEYDQASPPTDMFSQISAGGTHTCGLTNNGNAVCWGADEHGQSTPPIGIFKQISTGGYHTCALKNDDSVVCWGSNESDQIGQYDSYSTHTGDKFSQVSAGIYHTCALRSDGTAVCWGGSQLPIEIQDQTFTQISAGRHHTCALKHNGEAVCWGDDGISPLGVFKQISVGNNNSCGVKTNGDLVCQSWRLNDLSNYAIPTQPATDALPVTSFSPGQAMIIAAGGAHGINTLFPYTNSYTQKMYARLNTLGFSDGDITYLNPIAPDIDGDGYLEFENQDYDLSSPENQLTMAFTQIAKRLQTGQQFVLYIHGHAKPDFIQLTKNYELSATKLKSLMDLLPENTQQIIILDTVHSGSFLDKLAKVNRIILTSSDDLSASWTASLYEGFSGVLLTNLNHGENLQSVFKKIEQRIHSNNEIGYNYGSSQLDDNGDGLYTEEDGELSAKIYIGQPSTEIFTSPLVANFKTSQLSGRVPLDIQLDANISQGENIVEHIWDIDNKTRLEGNIVNFRIEVPGIHEVKLTIKDIDGKISQKAQKIEAFFPLTPPDTNSVGSAIIIAGGGAHKENILFNTTKKWSKFSYRTLASQGFNQNDIFYLIPQPPDIDSDGFIDKQYWSYDLSSPAQHIEEVFRKATECLSAEQQFFLHYIGPGKTDQLNISSNYTFTAEMLNTQLQQLQPGIQQILFLDSDYSSGSFLDDLSGVSERTIITPTAINEHNTDYLTSHKSISDFLKTILRGEFIEESFYYFSRMVEFNNNRYLGFSSQHPQLDDNGDGIYDSLDGEYTENMYLGFPGIVARRSTTSCPRPSIDFQLPEEIKTSTPLTLQADTSASNTPLVEYHWWLDNQLISEERSFNYTFNQEGDHVLTLFALNGEQRAAVAQKEIRVVNREKQGQAIILAAGGVLQNTLYPLTNQFAQDMYLLLKMRGYSDEDIIYLNPHAPNVNIPMDHHLESENLDFDLFDPQRDIEQAFTQAASRLKPGEQFIFYVHGHAQPSGRMYVLPPSPYYLSPQLLREQLDRLPEGIEQIIILDTCYSGMFFKELARPGRILLSSSDDVSLSWNSQQFPLHSKKG